jgi:hypothetical protein
MRNESKEMIIVKEIARHILLRFTILVIIFIFLSLHIMF